MKSLTCWTITGRFPGMKSQVLGLSEALGIPTIHKTCTRRWPWGWLGLPFGNPLTQLSSESDSLIPPWPDVVISCGRRSAPLALAIKKQSGGRTFCIHIQDPLVNRNAFDLIVAPQHDNLKGSNVITTKGALHKVTQCAIDQGVKTYASLFKDLPRPYNAVLIGGSTHKYTLTLEAMNDLIRMLRMISEKTKGSLLVTPSFRTPLRDVLRASLKALPNVFLAEIEEVNPYLAFLGVADTLFVTDDSVNMMCEACFTGKPTYILPLLGQPRSKAKTFAQELIEEKVLRPFEGEVEVWTYAPFNDTGRIAEIIQEKLSCFNGESKRNI